MATSPGHEPSSARSLRERQLLGGADEPAGAWQVQSGATRAPLVCSPNSRRMTLADLIDLEAQLARDREAFRPRGSQPPRPR
jgi:hypothetical protein